MLVFVIFYGLDWVATVPPTVALTRQMFGPTQGTVVFGWIFAAHQIGAATAAYVAGLPPHVAGHLHACLDRRRRACACWPPSSPSRSAGDRRR